MIPDVRARLAAKHPIGPSGISENDGQEEQRAHQQEGLRAQRGRGFPEREMARRDEVSQPTLIYPYWHQAWTANERLGAPDLALLAPYLTP